MKKFFPRLPVGGENKDAKRTGVALWSQTETFEKTEDDFDTPRGVGFLQRGEIERLGKTRRQSFEKLKCELMKRSKSVHKIHVTMQLDVVFLQGLLTNTAKSRVSSFSNAEQISTVML